MGPCGVGWAGGGIFRPRYVGNQWEPTSVVINVEVAFDEELAGWFGVAKQMDLVRHGESQGGNAPPPPPMAPRLQGMKQYMEISIYNNAYELKLVVSDDGMPFRIIFTYCDVFMGVFRNHGLNIIGQCISI